MKKLRSILAVLIIFIFNPRYIVSQELTANDTIKIFLVEKPSSPYTHYYNAMLNFNKGNYKKSIQYAKKNLLYQNDFQQQCAIILCQCYEQLGRYKKSESKYKYYASKWDTSSIFLFHYAFNQYKLRKYALAQQIIEKSLKSQPYCPEANYLYGFILFEQSKFKDCFKPWLIGLSVDTNTLRIRQMLKIASILLTKNYKQLTIPFYEKRLKLLFFEDLVFNYLNTNNDDIFNQFDISLLINEFTETQAKNSIYDNFFQKLINQQLIEAYIYFSMRNIDLPGIKKWYSNNSKILERLALFLENNNFILP